MKIVFLDTKTLGNDIPNISIFNDFGDYEHYPLTSSDERIQRMQDAEIVITNKVIINREVIDACPNLRLICLAATGINNIDLDYAAKKGIKVKNVAGYSTESVAQCTFGMLFYLLHRYEYFNNYVKTGEYTHSDIFTHYGRSFWQLNGKQIGIIGLGTIGKRIAEISKAFGMNPVYYSTSGKNNNASYPRLSLDELLKSSDIVSIHAPLNADTQNLINYDRIKQMKKTAILINMGRGGIVNESDLAKTLDENLIYGAALDVLTNEPIITSNPLLHIKEKERLLIMPHTAWASIEARSLLVNKIADNIREYLKL